ncbi:MAG: 3-deoxy-D-manno-octulosonic-acid transferase [Sphingobacteriales bacterium]|jgi:3-deoxy-D-manno-octulosonic-acid transferase
MLHSFLYLQDLGLLGYKALVSVASALGNSRAQMWIKGREHQALTPIPPEFKGRSWFHVASLGEFEQALPLIEKLGSNNVFVTFFSPSGFDVIRKRMPHLAMAYLPLPTQKNMVRWIHDLSPSCLVFTKYDFWWSLLHEAHKKNIPSYLISGKVKASDYFIKREKLGERLFQLFDKIHVQDQPSKDLLQSINQHSILSGDPRYDRVYTVSQETFQDPLIEQWAKNWDQVVVIGSAWEPEMQLASDIHQQLPKTGFIIAPHELHRAAPFLAGKNIAFNVYSKAGNNPMEQFLIIDQFGLLRKLYRFADFAIIGGGFGKGVHNLLEAAIYGIPTAFGPRHVKFSEAVEFVQEKASLVLDLQNLTPLLERLSSQDALVEMGAKAKKLCEKNIGATEHIFSDLFA